jgi:N-acetyl-alpha-D-muramate 1-phosphate uridylyltransferase
LSQTPKTAMVLAAGLGTRMRPLTDTRPKALIPVAGKALIDHTLDRLVEVGVERAVVNVHAFADQVEAHLARRSDLEILISDERDALLETGGGVKKARTLLGEAPIWVANSDYVWTGVAADGLGRLALTWDPARMDACVIVVPKARTLGFDTPGDFFPAEDGQLVPRGDAVEAPLHCFGVQIIDPRPIYAELATAFSLRRIWFAASEQGRLIGVVPDGLWLQVGDPEALEVAEARLAELAAAP